MTARHTKFYLDKRNGKFMGVCAGIADYTGVDVTLVRIGAVLLAVLGQGIGIIAYFAVGWIAPKKPRELRDETPEQTKFWQGVRASPTRTVRDVRSRFRDIDRRLADVETYVTSSNSRLAREIEQLR
jgi:phage shock protein C